MEWLGTAVVIVIIGLVTTLVVTVFQRGLEKPGARGAASAMGDGLGNFMDVFDPGMARSARDLKEQAAKTEVAPSPDPEDPEAPLALIKDATGRPAVVRINPDSTLPVQPPEPG